MLAKHQVWVLQLLGHALSTSRLRRAIALTGVTASTLLVLVLLSAHRSLNESVGAYAGQAPIGIWVAPRGTDNLIRSSALLPLSAAEALRRVTGVRNVSPILRGFVRVATPHAQARAINLLAIGYAAPAGLGGPPRLLSGRLPAPSGGIALDRAAAHRLGVGVGASLLVNGQVQTLIGITGGTNLFATQFAFVDAKLAEELSGYRERASFFAIALQAGASTAQVVQRIEALSPAYAAFTSAQFVSNNQQEVTAGFRPLQLLIAWVGVIVAAVLVALLVQGVVEDRTRDIAVLLALGARLFTVALSVLGHALALIVSGVVLGASGSLLLRAGLARWVPEVELSPALSDVWLVAALFGVAALVAAALPLLRLRRIDPVEAFRP